MGSPSPASWSASPSPEWRKPGTLETILSNQHRSANRLNIEGGWVGVFISEQFSIQDETRQNLVVYLTDTGNLNLYIKNKTAGYLKYKKKSALKLLNNFFSQQQSPKYIITSTIDLANTIVKKYVRVTDLIVCSCNNWFDPKKIHSFFLYIVLIKWHNILVSDKGAVIQ